MPPVWGCSLAFPWSLFVKRRRGMCLMELALRSKLWTSTEMHPQAKELYCRSLRDAPTVSQEPCLVILIPTQATRVSSDIPGLSECATVIPSMSMILNCGRSLRWTLFHSGDSCHMMHYEALLVSLQLGPAAYRDYSLCLCFETEQNQLVYMGYV